VCFNKVLLKERFFIMSRKLASSPFQDLEKIAHRLLRAVPKRPSRGKRAPTGVSMTVVETLRPKKSAGRSPKTSCGPQKFAKGGCAKTRFANPRGMQAPFDDMQDHYTSRPFMKKVGANKKNTYAGRAHKLSPHKNLANIFKK
jgi:hypothetical protein